MEGRSVEMKWIDQGEAVQTWNFSNKNFFSTLQKFSYFKLSGQRSGKIQVRQVEGIMLVSLDKKLWPVSGKWIRKIHCTDIWLNSLISKEKLDLSGGLNNETRVVCRCRFLYTHVLSLQLNTTTNLSMPKLLNGLFRCRHHDSIPELSPIQVRATLDIA